MSKTGYAKQHDTAMGLQNPRQTEAYALVEIARRMDVVCNDDQSTRQSKIDMFSLNWRLWTIFQSELSNPENMLPEEIKINMLQLSNFIDKHTINEMQNPTVAGLKVLININRQVAAGLLGDGGDGLDDRQRDRLEDIKSGQALDAAAASGSPPTQQPAAQVNTAETSTAVKPKKPRFTTKKVD